MRTRLILITLFITAAIANYLPFTQSAYWINAGTFLSQNSTYQIGQTNSPDNSSDYQLTSSTLPACQQVYNGWEIDHHLLRATPTTTATKAPPTTSSTTPTAAE